MEVMERIKRIKTCIGCGDNFQFYAFNIEYKRRKYCTRICANKQTANANSISKMGEKNPMYGKHPWNYKKYGVQKGRRGKDNHFWKGGKTDTTHRARQSGVWKKWRLAVYERDNYTCQICKVKGDELIPHHIKLYRFYPRDRYKVGNGVTLCRKHHRGLHNKNVGKKIIKI